jgi:prepilin peptidase CpaA
MTFAVPLYLALLVPVIATYDDLTSHRIPNNLVLLELVSGIAFQLSYFGVAGLLHAFLGMLIGFGLFIPFYALGGMAAGDVKLMAAVGAWFTPYGALMTGLFSIVFGGVLALIYLFARSPQEVWASIKILIYGRKLVFPAGVKSTFPYALAILCGTFCAVFYI